MTTTRPRGRRAVYTVSRRIRFTTAQMEALRAMAKRRKTTISDVVRSLADALRVRNGRARSQS